MVGIKQAIVTMGESTNSITFPVESKPWGILVARSTDDSIYGLVVVTRVSAIWTEYSGGSYVGGRYTITRSNGVFDHYAILATGFAYDDTNKTFTITVASGINFVEGETYYLWYFTIPF